MPALDIVRTLARRSRFVLVGGSLLLLAILWLTWLEFARYERAQALGAAGRRQGNMIIAVSHYLGRAMSNADALSQFLVKAHDAPGLAFQEVLEDRAAANELFNEIVFCEADGTWSSSRNGAAGADEKGWCDAWLATAPADSRSYPAASVMSKRGPLIPLLTRAPSGGKPGAGLVALLVELPRLLGLLKDYSIPDETVVLVLGTDGRSRARWHSVKGMGEQRAPEAALLPVLGSSLGQVHTIEGRPMIVSARRVENRPLIVMVATDQAQTLHESGARARYIALALAGATLLLPISILLVLRLQERIVGSAHALAQAQDALNKLNAELEGEVKARTLQLERAYQDLETFSYSVAHDVRAPIGAIKGFAEVLAGTVEASGNAKAVHYLKRISANASQMDELAESLLLLGKLSRVTPVRTEVDLAQVTRDVIEAHREAEPARDVQVTVEGPLSVMADRVLMRQVMENLLGNAWKFTSRRAEAHIQVTGRRDGETGETTVCVRDNGEGFEARPDADLFKPFQRMHAASDFPGTGVGLATVARVIRRHGGRVWIESAVGEGTLVCFTLPQAAIHAAEAQAAPPDGNTRSS